MSDIQKFFALEMSNYIRPEIKEVQGKKWVLNGKNNEFYKDIIDAYNGSTTNSAIIDSYSQFIYGKGLLTKGDTKQLGEVKAIFSKADLRRICKDFEMFGEAAIEVKYLNGKVRKCFHVPKQRIAPEVADENGNITGYWYSYDFANVHKYKPVRFDAFGYGDGLGQRSEIYIIGDYQVGQFYYKNPSYVSGLSWAKFEEEFQNYCINHIKNGLSAGYIINVNGGVQESEIEIQKHVTKMRTDLSGSSNSGKFFINFNDGKDSEMTIAAVETSEAHKQYEYLCAEARQQLMTAHKLTSPMLVGVKEASGFSSNAEEIKVGFAELMINVIQPKQEIILDSIMNIVSVNGISIELEFESLRSEPTQDIIQQTPTQLSEKKKTFDDLGEEIDLNEWELISSNEVDYDKEQELDAELEQMNSVSLNLMNIAMASVSTGTARPNAKSEQDGALFKSLYRYSGNPNPEREFCKAMILANKLYRKEDIEMMSQRNVNPGFGMKPNPNNPYDIFLYKGGGLLSDKFPGGTCKHFWIRETYRKRADVNNPLAEIVTPAEARKQGEILPTNNPKAYIAPHDMK